MQEEFPAQLKMIFTIKFLKNRKNAFTPDSTVFSFQTVTMSSGLGAG